MTIGIYKQTASDIMTRHVATIRSNETVHDALLLMSDNRLSALPVVDQSGRCVGIVSQSDLIAMARDADNDDSIGSSFASLFLGEVPLGDITRERIQDVMSEDVVTVSPEDSAVSIADQMVRKEVHHLPVCDGNGRLLGIVSTMDLINSLRSPIPV